MTAVVKDQARFVETAVEDEAVIMLLDTGDFFSLKDSARAIWDLIDGQRDREQILAALAAAYDSPPEVLAADVDAFLDELRGVGLIRTG